MTIGIIDYGMGNLKNVANAIEFLGGNCFISDDYNRLSQADQLILPGVGAFKDAITRIRQKKFVSAFSKCQYVKHSNFRHLSRNAASI